MHPQLAGVSRAAAAWLPQVGDASGIQSPLSFGGFGALSRHLGRLAGAIKEAVEARETNRQEHADVDVGSVLGAGLEHRPSCSQAPGPSCGT